MFLSSIDNHHNFLSKLVQKRRRAIGMFRITERWVVVEKVESHAGTRRHCVRVTGLRAVPDARADSYPRTLLSRIPLWHPRANSLECRSGRTPCGPTRGDCSRDPLRLSGPPRYATRAGNPCLEP